MQNVQPACIHDTIRAQLPFFFIADIKQVGKKSTDFFPTRNMNDLTLSCCTTTKHPHM